MATRKIAKDRGSVKKGIAAASSVTTKEKPDKSKAGTKLIPVRMNEIDYNRLKGLFGAEGLALARAGSLALSYVGEMVSAGRLSISKAGIIDRG
jgi:hypothetical protein